MWRESYFPSCSFPLCLRSLAQQNILLSWNFCCKLLAAIDVVKWFWLIDHDTGLEKNVSAEIGVLNSNCMCISAGTLGRRDLGAGVFARVMVNCTVGTALRSRTLIAFVPPQLVLIGIGTGHRCLLWPGNTEGDYLRKLESPATYIHTMFCMSGRPHIPILKRTIRWHCLEALPPSIFHDLLLSTL